MKKLIYGLLGTALLLAVASCNDDKKTTNEITVVTSSAQVSNFSMNTNSKYVKNMDSVFFSIDQLNLTIYNADSLPQGSNITKLVPSVTATGATVVEFHVPRVNKPDTIYNYLNETKDSIDFSSGNVRLRIVAADGVSTATYRVRVNVHKVATDTIVWQRIDGARLPSQFQTPTAQRTVRAGKTLCCLTRSGDNFCMATSVDPMLGWAYKAVTFGFTPVLGSLTASDDALYILDSDDNLYVSNDLGGAWQPCGVRMNHIYGVLGTKLIGALRSSGLWYCVTYPASAAVRIADNMPVAATSQPLVYTPEMGTGAQLVFVGGRKADGSVSGDSWGYDGNVWAMISRRPLPAGMTDMSVTNYYVIDNSTYNNRTRYPVTMALNGRKADGSLNKVMYVSRDFGVHWAEADSLLQMPAAVPARTNAQIFTVETTMTAGKTKAQPQFTTVWARPAAVRTGITTTAMTPITEWQCPYLYMFGGVNAEGATFNTLYRGVLTDFTFKPLQ